MHPDMDTSDNFIIAGPLNLNKSMMRADTVMGERLQLNPGQFRSLLMLVINEGVSIPFEELHMYMTMPEEEKYSIQEARDVINSLVNIVNISGRGFAKINMLPDDEYSFVTKWGMDWHKTNEISEANKKPVIAAAAKYDGFSKKVLSVALAAVLVVFIGSYFAFSTNDNGLIYIPMSQIPLSEMPDFGGSVSFPYLEDNTFYVSGGNTVYIDTYNSLSGSYVFMLCLLKPDIYTPISRSVPVPRGDTTITVKLFESLEPGRHETVFSMRAFCGRLLTEVESISKRIVIYVE